MKSVTSPLGSRTSSSALVVSILCHSRVSVLITSFSELVGSSASWSAVSELVPSFAVGVSIRAEFCELGTVFKLVKRFRIFSEGGVVCHVSTT